MVGQSDVLVGARRIVQPCRNGSVFDAFKFMWTRRLMICMSDRSNVVSLNLLMVGDTYSEDRRKPKNAVRKAAHSIVWSKMLKVELVRCLWSWCSSSTVIGERAGRLVCPELRFIARVSMYSLGSGGISWW